MSTIREKINKYINDKGLLKTPAHYIKELLIGIIDKIDEIVDTIIELNIIPYVQNKIAFDTEELNIDTKNGYYYTENRLENLKITKVDDTICPKVEFYGYCLKLQLPKNVVLQNKYVDFDGLSKYIINFDNNNCKIDQYTWDLSEHLIATYLEGTVHLSDYLLTGFVKPVFESLSSGLLMTTGPVHENEQLITKVGTSIDSYTFNDCYGLTSIIIGNSVTSIGYGAFKGCSSLTSVTIPNSVTSIGGWAFQDCSSLTSIKIPNNVTFIGEDAFRGCSRFTSITIPDSITSISDGVFSNCSSLTSISIPNNITKIGGGAFSGCSSLTSITIPNNVTRIENYAFSNCSSLTSIEIPNSVTSIGPWSFSGCSSLTSISIPNSITSIEHRAFEYCSSLTSITIESTTPPTLLGTSSFMNTNTNLKIYVPLESVDLYKSATNWSEYADRILPIPN